MDFVDAPAGKQFLKGRNLVLRGLKNEPAVPEKLLDIGIVFIIVAPGGQALDLLGQLEPADRLIIGEIDTMHKIVIGNEACPDGLFEGVAEDDLAEKVGEEFGPLGVILPDGRGGQAKPVLENLGRVRGEAFPSKIVHLIGDQQARRIAGAERLDKLRVAERVVGGDEHLDIAASVAQAAVDFGNQPAARSAVAGLGKVHRTYAEGFDLFAPLIDQGQIGRGDHGQQAVYGPGERTLNPDRDLNGASRRALTLSFILALTDVSEVEAPNIIDTPLGMMSGFVKRSVLRTAIKESSQLVLFLTRSEIEGCEAIIDEWAGHVCTLTNPAHYPRMLVHKPPTGESMILRCACNHRRECEICERRYEAEEPGLAQAASA